MEEQPFVLFFAFQQDAPAKHGSAKIRLYTVTLNLYYY